MPQADYWTVEEALAAGALFVTTYGRTPVENDLRAPDCGLPYRSAVLRLFGSIPAYLAQLPHPPAPVDQCRERQCLMCDAVFLSAHTGHRICATCKAQPAWHDTTDWMLGVPVTWKT